MSKGIYLFVGESGNGKTTVVDELERLYNLKPIQSYSTRPKRHENETGHVFVSEDDFDQLKDLVAYTKFNGYRYCATFEQVETNELYVIDPTGIDYFKNHYCGYKTPYIIYIYASLKERIERMKKRGDSDNQILQRIVNDCGAFRDMDKLYDVAVWNNNLSSCVEECYKFIQKSEGDA